MLLQRQAAHLLRTPRPHYRVGRALLWSLSEVRRLQTTFYDAVSLRLILILSSKHSSHQFFLHQSLVLISVGSTRSPFTTHRICLDFFTLTTFSGEYTLRKFSFRVSSSRLILTHSLPVI